MNELDSKVVKIVNAGYDLTIKNVVKRIDGEWYIRTIWEAEKDDKLIQCKWVGFKTIEECLSDAYELLIVGIK